MEPKKELIEGSISLIKKFWGNTENAVRILVAVAITTYCLVAIVKHDLHLKRSTYEILQILSISLTDQTPLTQLFEKMPDENFIDQDENLNLFP